MAISISDSDLDDDNDFAETHEINVTPFIDVILVLLIIFMVAAPLSTVDLPIDLPSSTAVPQKKPDKPTYLTIKPDLALAIGENPVKRSDLVSALDAMADSSKDRFIFLRADRAVPYGEMMDVLEILRAGGYSKIKLVRMT
jgi:biopolymer transport protein ExbD